VTFADAESVTNVLENGPHQLDSKSVSYFLHRHVSSRAVKWVCVCVHVSTSNSFITRCKSINTTLDLFNGLFSRTAWLSRYQKGDFNEARDDGVLGYSGIS